MTEPRPPLLLTRPAGSATGFAAAFHARFGADWPLILSPLLEIVPLTPPEAELARARDAGAVIFTSASAVAPFAALSPPRGRLAWCVGGATARAAAAAGFDTRPAGGDAVSLIALILEQSDSTPLIHARGRHLAADLRGALCAAGRDCDEITVYDQRALPLTDAALAALAGAAPVLAPVFSPRSARFLAAAAQGARAPIWAAAISAAAAAPLAALHPERLDIAHQPDAGAILDALSRLTGAA